MRGLVFSNIHHINNLPETQTPQWHCSDRLQISLKAMWWIPQPGRKSYLILHDLLAPKSPPWCLGWMTGDWGEAAGQNVCYAPVENFALINKHVKWRMHEILSMWAHSGFILFFLSFVFQLVILNALCSVFFLRNTVLIQTTLTHKKQFGVPETSQDWI